MRKRRWHMLQSVVWGMVLLALFGVGHWWWTSHAPGVIAEHQTEDAAIAAMEESAPAEKTLPGKSQKNEEKTVASSRANSQSAALHTLPHAGTGTTSTIVCPILVYHGIRDADPSEPADVRQFNVSPAEFDRQLSYLIEHNFTPITFDELAQAIKTSAPLPEKPVIITFDDGWRSQYQNGFPLLKKHGIQGTFFLFTNAMDHENFMTWAEVQELADAGMTIGSHSKAHQYMNKQEADVLPDEIVLSKSILEDRLGIDVTTFAYPFGVFTPEIQDMVEKAGYTAARQFDKGKVHTIDDLYALKSYEVTNNFFEFTYILEFTPQL